MGAVSRLKVGDEFQYRMQGRINYVKQGKKIHATSIVASTVDNSDVLIYTGQGGNVIVIRGCESSDGKSKTCLRQEPEPHGKLVFKSQLDRIPSQPELVWKQGLCVTDISQGKEPMPKCDVNTIDDEKPPPFTYITSVIYIPIGCAFLFLECASAVKNGGEIPFNHNGAIVEAKPLLYEYGPSCRGWGVRSLNFIPSGSFVCEYIGELLKEKEAKERAGNDKYLFDIGNNYNDSSLWDGLSTLIPDTHLAPCEVVEDGGLTIDAAQYGNMGRFINHSCTPNLNAQNVLFDHDDRRIPHFMLFSTENIPPLLELTYHYNYTIDQVRDSNGNIRKKECFCGSHECSGRLY
ncbi:hypothetical protein UlMin_001513 [Ulmus minor]